MQTCQRCGIRDSTSRYLVSPEQCKHDGSTHHHGSTREWFLTKCSLCGTVLESEPRSERNEKLTMAKELKKSHNKQALKQAVRMTTEHTMAIRESAAVMELFANKATLMWQNKGTNSAWRQSDLVEVLGDAIECVVQNRPEGFQIFLDEPDAPKTAASHGCQYSFRLVSEVGPVLVISDQDPQHFLLHLEFHEGQEWFLFQYPNCSNDELIDFL